MEKDPTLDVVFITLEEQRFPIENRFLSRHINLSLSRNNAKTLAHFYKYYDDHDQWKRMAMFDEKFRSPPQDLYSTDKTELEKFLEKEAEFEEKFALRGRLRILDFLYENGALTFAESLCNEIKEFKKRFPKIGMIVFDYMQLLESDGKEVSREAALKDISLLLKNTAVETGLAIVTAAQFNRTVLNEDGMHAGAVGEGGSIERHCALMFCMYNRNVPQKEGTQPMRGKALKNEILLIPVLNRNGPANHRLIVPYDGNIGRIDFDGAQLESANNDPATNAEKASNHAGSRSKSMPSNNRFERLRA